MHGHDQRLARAGSIPVHGPHGDAALPETPHKAVALVLAANEDGDALGLHVFLIEPRLDLRCNGVEFGSLALAGNQFRRRTVAGRPVIAGLLLPLFEIGRIRT